MNQVMTSPCIDIGVDPLLAELRESVELFHSVPDDADRVRLQSFVSDVFRQVHGAEVSAFQPNLLGFSTRADLRAVLGYRAAGTAPLFSEQYLDCQAQHLIAARFEETVARDDLVEVGNFALADPGQARWVIAATTTFLAAAGYRWVMFTATRPLANAFRRLGLRPLALAPADPARLADKGESWGRYYDAGPQVYVGDIQAGYDKLHAGIWSRGPHLRNLLVTAWDSGARSQQFQGFASTRQRAL